MVQHVLLTGISGYLGGDLLACISAAGPELPAYKLYALVRNDAQADAARERGVEPVTFDPYRYEEARDIVMSNKITVVFYLIDALRSGEQVNFIKALPKVRKATGLDVHYIHTSGAKVFSSHAGAPTNRQLFDDEPDLYEIQKAQKAPHPAIQLAVETNRTVIEQATQHGVRSYIVAPCLVYIYCITDGKSESFGNRISIQTSKVVQAARALKRVYRTDTGRPLAILGRILNGAEIGYGEQGYYLASSGDVVWDDLYDAMARALKTRRVVDDESVVLADDAVIDQMGAAIQRPKEFVPVELGGLCTFTSRNGKNIGWEPEYPADYILRAADEEVDRILNSER